MPRKKKSAYEKYMAAQNSIKSILAKYDGNRETILTGRSIFRLSKDEQFRQHYNDYKKIHRLEKVVKDYENSSSALPSQIFFVLLLILHKKIMILRVAIRIAIIAMLT